MICPFCHSRDIKVFYTAPLTYECNGCGQRLVDEHARTGFEVVSGDTARRKRPAMYGDPVCSCCPHAPHDGDCEFCEGDKPREVKLVAPRH